MQQKAALSSRNASQDRGQGMAGLRWIPLPLWTLQGSSGIDVHHMTDQINICIISIYDVKVKEIINRAGEKISPFEA